MTTWTTCGGACPPPAGRRRRRRRLDAGHPVGLRPGAAEYWRDDYDWRRARRPQRASDFIAEIDGLDIHFIHARSPHDDAMPLLITHGWPGSIVEFQKVIGPLTDPTAHGGTASRRVPRRHPVAARATGSAASRRRRLGRRTDRQGMGRADGPPRLRPLRRPGRRLGLGGDDRSSAHRVTRRDPHEHADGACPPAGELDDPTEAEQQALERREFTTRMGLRLFEQQWTRPQTLGYGLVDSPAGQAAWILEKFWRWTDCDDHPENVFRRDELLDNVLMYWFTATGASSARMYWESFGRFRRGPRLDCPPASRRSRRKLAGPRAVGVRPITASPAGRPCREVDTLLRSSNPNYSPKTSGPSSRRCGDGADAAFPVVYPR